MTTTKRQASGSAEKDVTAAEQSHSNDELASLSDEVNTAASTTSGGESAKSSFPSKRSLASISGLQQLVLDKAVYDKPMPDFPWDAWKQSWSDLGIEEAFGSGHHTLFSYLADSRQSVDRDMRTLQYQHLSLIHI